VVALKDGKPDKKRYRTYHVRTAVAGDDYHALFEVLGRRFRRGRAAAESEALQETPEGRGASAASTESGNADWQLPDLFVVDGGRGQLGVALAAAHDLGLHDLPIVGLAKERETVGGDKLVDRVYLPGQKNPIPLRPNSPELFLLAMARDEAHRFANRGRKKTGKRRRFESQLDSVAGIGPKTKKALLRELGSLATLKAASDEQILAVTGVTRRHLVALREHMARLPEPPVEVSPTTSTEEKSMPPNEGGLVSVSPETDARGA
jgi:excinuclease ABC subunit C